MQEQTTYPALLSSETIPVPLARKPSQAEEASPLAKRDWLRPALLIAAVVSALLLLNPWW